MWMGMISWSVVAGVLGLLAFYLWRRLKGELTEEEILEFISFMYWMGLAGGVLGAMCEGRRWVVAGWGVVVVGVAALWWWCNKKKWDFWEYFDMLAVASLWVWLGMSLAFGLVVGVIASVAMLLIVGMIRSKYKNLWWYPSGKVGLVGLCGLGGWCVYEILVALTGVRTVYWSGISLSQMVAGWVLAYVVVAIYTRGGGKFLWTRKKD
jgi:hypothetical protein